MSAFGNKINKLSQIQKRGATATLPGERIEEVDPELVDCGKQIRSKDNPGFTVESLTELGNDMRRDGQHEPVILRKNPKKPGHYLMVAGERRWRACKVVGIKLKAVIRELTDEQARRVQRAENIQRENLTQLEIAVALRDDKDRLGTLEKVASEWSKGINWVAERLKFLEAVEANGYTSQAVAAGVTADITSVNELHRLEKSDSAAARAVIEQAKADPSTNMRKAVREKLQDAKPAGREKRSEANSRMRETGSAASAVDLHQPGKFNHEKSAKPATTQLDPEVMQLAASAIKQAETLCVQISTLSKMLQQRPDVVSVLGDALQNALQVQTELFRTRHALAELNSLSE